MKPSESIVIRGIPASPGIAIGKVHFFEPEDLHVGERKVPAEETDREVEKFKAGLVTTREEIEQIRETIRT
jgi:phosphotransferase system enzyme I (PtsI)